MSNDVVCCTFTIVLCAFVEWIIDMKFSKKSPSFWEMHWLSMLSNIWYIYQFFPQKHKYIILSKSKTGLEFGVPSTYLLTYYKNIKWIPGGLISQNISMHAVYFTFYEDLPITRSFFGSIKNWNVSFHSGSQVLETCLVFWIGFGVPNNRTVT